MQDITSRITVWYLKQAYHALLHEYLGHIEVIKRLDRAYDILCRDERYSITLASKSPTTFVVTGPNDAYTVIDSQRLCTCPDSEILCKHRLVAKLIVQATERQYGVGRYASV